MLTKVIRKRIDPHALYGVILNDRASALLVVHQERDLQFDGVIVIRRKDVTQLLDRTSRTHERVMRKEKLWVSPPRWVKRLPTASWGVLLKAMTGRLVILENERSSEFWLGELMAVSATHADISCLDAELRWTGVQRVPLRAVTLAKFLDRYSTLLGKHAAPNPWVKR